MSEWGCEHGLSFDLCPICTRGAGGDRTAEPEDVASLSCEKCDEYVQRIAELERANQNNLDAWANNVAGLRAKITKLERRLEETNSATLTLMDKVRAEERGRYQPLLYWLEEWYRCSDGRICNCSDGHSDNDPSCSQLQEALRALGDE